MSEPRSATALLLALLPTSYDAEAAVNNLTEEGISQRHISVVTVNEADARAIINPGGPLDGVSAAALGAALESHNLPAPDAQAYSQGVSEGHALVAVSASPDAVNAVTATLAGYSPLRTSTLTPGASA